jgi:hypothetical protein
MSLGKITGWAALLLACTWALCSSPAASAAEAVPGLLSPAPSAMPTVPPHAEPAEAAETPQTSDGPAYNVVRVAGGTVEFAVPRDWTIKQVPLSREIRLVAGPGDVHDDPSHLERGLWLAYHRTTTVTPAATMALPARPTMEDELRGRLPQAAGADSRIVGPPDAIKIGGFRGLKQRLELAGAADAELRRASYVIAQTPWGVLEMMAVAPLFAEGDLSAKLGAIVTSLVFHAPQPLPAISAPEITDAQAVLGSWKGQKGLLHLLPNGRARLEFDAVTTLGLQQQVAAVSRRSAETFEGRFSARGDLLFITWDDGRKLNYRWRLDQGELQLIDHERKCSRLRRLFDASAAATSPLSPTTAVVSSLPGAKGQNP